MAIAGRSVIILSKMKHLLPILLLAGCLAPAVSAQEVPRAGPPGADPPGAGQARAEAPKAPSRIYPAPPSFLLLLLRGDHVDVRYTPGSLDRAANLQLRMELMSEIFEKWSKPPPKISLFVLSREEWQRVGYRVPYGLSMRVGQNQIAAPSLGDDDTVRLWGALLHGVLPNVPGMPILGTPQHAATLVLSDTLVQLQAAEILVDEIGLGTEELWLRGVMTHLVSLSISQRLEPRRRGDLDTMYGILSRVHPPKSFSPRDFDPDLGLRDWFWFQAQFHRGAAAILDDEGKDAIKRMIRLDKKDRLSEGELRQRYEGFDTWLRETWTKVSTRVE